VAPIYEYEAVNRSGEKVAGRIEVERESMVAKQLKNNGYFVASIKEVKEGSTDIGEYFAKRKKVTTQALTIFSHQFAAMIDAGISLVEALSILYEETEHLKLKEIIRNIQEDIETGSSLFEALQKHPETFPPLFCQLVRAGEAGGVLDRVLNQLAAHYERQGEINNRIKSAIRYPAIVVSVAVLVVIFLLVVVVPTFVNMFAELGGDLPGPTKILIGTSEFLKGYWWVLLLVIIALLGFLKIFRSTPEGEYKIDNMLLRIPVIGNMIKKIAISRFSSTLAILLGSGVDLLSSLEIVEEVVGNRVYSSVLVDTRGQIREGVNLSRPLGDSPYFPSMVTQMVKIGEESGNLELMLNKITTFYNREVENAIDASIGLIEPAMIVFLSVVVGFIVLSIVMPMFTMMSLF
jgi:type IV pilus assembly protein PilC